LKEQLRLLLKLQAIDARVKDLETKMAKLPEALESDKKTLARLEQMLDGERARLAETERWRRDQEDLIRQEDEAIRRAKVKVQSAKGSKDYAAATREVDNKRRAKSEREDELLKVMEALEKAKAELESHEADVGKLRDRVEEEQTQVDEELGELAVEAEQRTEGRDGLVAQIEAALMKRYDRVRRQRGSAVAPVRDGTCLGCHMALPPQLNNTLAAGATVEFCPRCNRIVFREEMLEELTSDPADSDGDSDSAAAAAAEG